MCADLEVHITAWVSTANRHICKNKIHYWSWQPDFSWSSNWSFWSGR